MKSFVFLAGVLAIAAINSVQPAFAEGDADAGAKVFNKCKACHSLEAGQNKIGPSLAGLLGRQAGSVEGFKYSDALKGADITWDETNLASYLANPKEFIPGNKMMFPGIKKTDEMSNLLAYLQANM